MPLRASGFSAAGVEIRADAAFLAGALGSLGEVQKAAGVDTVAQLRLVYPAHVDALNETVDSLGQKGAGKKTRLWQSDQPQPTQGLQRSCTRDVQKKLKDDLLTTTGQRHAAAIRSASTSEASRFLDPPQIASDKMTDLSFLTAARRRLGLTPVPLASQTATHCQNKKPDGRKCDVALDSEGHHCSVCEVGGGLLHRHDGFRDLLANRLTQDIGAPCQIEQRCPQFDRRRENGTVSEARLDIAVDLDGTSWLVDVSIVDVLSTDMALERQRAVRDGGAASGMEDKKRSKYPGPTVVPIIVESYGRMNVSGLAWLRRVYTGQPEKLQSLLCAISAHVQSHTSAMIRAACCSHSFGAARLRGPPAGAADAIIAATTAAP